MTKRVRIEFDLDQYQINLIRKWGQGEADNLHDTRIDWDGVPDEDDNHRRVYGTTNYDEAQQLIDDILSQLPPDKEAIEQFSQNR